MSTHAEASHDTHNHDHDSAGASHSTLKGYLIGFVLAVILTAIPFWLVMDHVIASAATAGLVIMALAAVQIVVHMVYFLHMNTRSEGGWNMMALIFTVIVVVISMAGSIWVMYHMNQNMMPMNMHDMQNVP